MDTKKESWFRKDNRETDVTTEHTASSIARHLAEEIHAGRYTSGEMLPSERGLCETYGVGRNVIREALTVVQGMGLLEQEPGKRPRVVAPTLAKVMEGVGSAAQFFFSGSEGVAHLEQARLFLETSLLRYAVTHATNAQVGKLVEAIERCERSIGDPMLFREADARFHRALSEIPGNPIFVALHDTFVERLMNRREVLPDFETRNALSNQEHREMVDAILDQDVERGEEVITRHLTRNFGTYFRRAMERRPTDTKNAEQPNNEGESV